jgi:ribosome-associated protein
VKEAKGKRSLSTPALSRASARRAPERVSKVRPDAEETLRLVLASIDDMKAEDTAIADRVVQDLNKAGLKKVRVEGMPHCDWVLIDAGDVIVHVFRPEVRTFYQIEKMWAGGPKARAS